MVFAPTLRRAAAQTGTAFGPKIAYTPRVAGFDLKSATQAGTLAASFGVFAGTAALFMFGDIPRVRRDILQQLPFFDTYLDRTIAPEDNPF